MKFNSQKIAIIGMWHQGVVGAACLAEIGHNIIGLDKDKKKIDKLNNGEAPLFEPKLDKLIQSGIKNNKLKFSHNLKSEIKKVRVIFIMFDIPVDENDKSDLSELKKTIKEISPYIKSKTIVYITSQVPIGTCREIEETINKINPKIEFDIAYSPENLRLGNAIELYKNPALPLIGCSRIETFDYLKEIFKPLETKWIHSSVKTAEMTKHALNSFLALSITFANELGNICDEYEADGHKIAEVLRLEPRVGKKAMIYPGLGFSGATLARDIQTLRSLSKKKKLNSFLIEGLWNSNLKHNELIERKIIKIYKSLKNLPITVLGLTYKPDTSTLRRSASISIIKNLSKKGALISGHDPKADRSDLKKLNFFKFHEDVYESIKSSKVVILVTPWEEYKNLDFDFIKKIMKQKPLILDTNNLFDGDLIESKGFFYQNIGSGRK